MSLLSASSSISSLVMQLRHIESTIAGILLEVVLKLSSLTDSDIFLVVEDAGRRSWMGRRRFREAFLDGSLAATPVDVEWSLEGDRIVRRQGVDGDVYGGVDGDVYGGVDGDLEGNVGSLADLRGLDAEEEEGGLEEAMTSFVSPSKKPELASPSDDHPDSSGHLSKLLLFSPPPPRSPSSSSGRRRRLSLFTSVTPSKRLCLSPLARPAKETSMKDFRHPMMMDLAVKDEPTSDSEIQSRNRQTNEKDGAATPDNEADDDDNDDERDADYEPSESGKESEFVDVGTNSFRKFRTSRRLKKKPCCFTPVKKTRSGSSKSGGPQSSGCGGGKGGCGGEKGGCANNTSKMPRIVLRGKQSFTRKSPRRKTDDEKDDRGEEGEEEERAEKRDSSHRAMRLRNRKEGEGEEDDKEEEEHREEGEHREQRGEKERESEVKGLSAPKKRRSRDKASASGDGKSTKTTTMSLSNDFAYALHCQGQEDAGMTSKARASPTQRSTFDMGVSGLRKSPSGFGESVSVSDSTSGLAEATIVNIQSVRIVERDGSEGPASPQIVPTPQKLVSSQFPVTSHSLTAPHIPFTSHTMTAPYTPVGHSVVRNLSNDMSSCHSPATISEPSSPPPHSSRDDQVTLPPQPTSSGNLITPPFHGEAAPLRPLSDNRPRISNGSGQDPGFDVSALRIPIQQLSQSHLIGPPMNDKQQQTLHQQPMQQQLQPLGHTQPSQEQHQPRPQHQLTPKQPRQSPPQRHPKPISVPGSLPQNSVTIGPVPASISLSSLLSSSSLPAWLQALAPHVQIAINPNSSQGSAPSCLVPASSANAPAPSSDSPAPSNSAPAPIFITPATSTSVPHFNALAPSTTAPVAGASAPGYPASIARFQTAIDNASRPSHVTQNAFHDDAVHGQMSHRPSVSHYLADVPRSADPAVLTQPQNPPSVAIPLPNYSSIPAPFLHQLQTNCVSVAPPRSLPFSPQSQPTLLNQVPPPSSTLPLSTALSTSAYHRPSTHPHSAVSPSTLSTTLAWRPTQVQSSCLIQVPVTLDKSYMSPVNHTQAPHISDVNVANHTQASVSSNIDYANQVNGPATSDIGSTHHLPAPVTSDVSSINHTIFPMDASLFTGFDPFMGETVVPLGSPSDGISGATGAYEVVSTPSSAFLPTISPSTLSSALSHSSTHVSPGSSFSSVFPSISLSPVTPPTGSGGIAVSRCSGGGGRGNVVGVTSGGIGGIAVSRGGGGRVNVGGVTSGGADSAIEKLPKAIRGRGRAGATPASRTSLTQSQNRTSLTPSFPRVSGGKPLSFIKSVSSKSIEEKRAASKAKRVKARETQPKTKNFTAAAAMAQRRTYSKKTEPAELNEAVSSASLEADPQDAESQVPENPDQFEVEVAVSMVLLQDDFRDDDVAEVSGNSATTGTRTAVSDGGDAMTRSGTATTAGGTVTTLPAGEGGNAAEESSKGSASCADAVPVIAIIEDDSPRLSDSEINCEKVTLANNMDEFDSCNPSFAKRRGVSKVVQLDQGKSAVKTEEEQNKNKPLIEHSAVMGYDTCNWKGFNYYHQKNNSVKTPYVHFKCQVPGCSGRLTLHKGSILTTTKHSANQCKFQSSLK